MGKWDTVIGPITCVRCGRDSRNATRHVGKLRLVRDRTICVSCYNREREILAGANAKGGRPTKWMHLQPAVIELEKGGKIRVVNIGLCSGEPEALRLAERRWPEWTVLAYLCRERGAEKEQ
jgi:hypothetical protein